MSESNDSSAIDEKKIESEGGTTNSPNYVQDGLVMVGPSLPRTNLRLLQLNNFHFCSRGTKFEW